MMESLNLLVSEIPVVVESVKTHWNSLTGEQQTISVVIGGFLGIVMN